MIKEIKFFLEYQRRIKQIKKELNTKFNIRIDNAYRMYTVINIPNELLGEAYSIRKGDIDIIAERYTKEYSKELSKFLNENNLSELYEIYRIQKVDRFSYLIVIGFSLFRSDKFYNTIYFRILPIVITISIFTLIYLLYF